MEALIDITARLVKEAYAAHGHEWPIPRLNAKALHAYMGELNTGVSMDDSPFDDPTVFLWYLAGDLTIVDGLDGRKWRDVCPSGGFPPYPKPAYITWDDYFYLCQVHSGGKLCFGFS
jgi:hypothetical protein